MPPPRLTFFCELETTPLQELFAAPELIEDLKLLKASVSLGLLDLSAGRAEVVRQLNRAGIPVVAWLLLPKDQGYWLNLDNILPAVARYAALKAWTAENHLIWDGVGLDVEPSLRIVQALAARKRRVIPAMLLRAVQGGRLRRGRKIYRELADQIRADGYRVDSYQFPLIVDERKAHSGVLQRLTGVVDIPADREVLMLYTSFLRPHGSGLVWSYAPEAQSVGLGSTGGGVDISIGDSRPLDWDELARDLRHAWYLTGDIHIFSLEGCIQQGFLKRLKTFEWDSPIMQPTAAIRRIENWRGSLQSALWLVSHWPVLAAGFIGGLLLLVTLRRRRLSEKR